MDLRLAEPGLKSLVDPVLRVPEDTDDVREVMETLGDGAVCLIRESMLPSFWACMFGNWKMRNVYMML